MSLEGQERRVWWVVMMLLAAVALRIYSIPFTYMREDEEISFRTTSRDFAYTVWYQAEQDSAAPLWFVSFWAWQQVAGSTEFAGRVYSILLSALTLAVIYRLGRTWFGAARYGMFAVAILGVNSYFHVYALEIRPYALVMLIGALSMWAFHRWTTQRTWRAAALYGVTAALMLYIHYFFIFLITAQALYFLMELILRRGGSQTHSYRDVLFVLQGVGVGALAFALWLPWFPTFITQVARLHAIETATGDARGLGMGSTAELTNWERIFSLIQIITNGQFVLYGLVLLLGVALLWRRRPYWLALLWGIGAPMIALAVNLIAAVYAQRYVTYLIEGLALALGAALATLAPRLRLAALGIFVALNLWMLPAHLPVHTPYRDLFQQVSALAQPGDVVYFKEGRGGRYTQWHIDHYLAPMLRDHIAGSLDDALKARRIWFVTAKLFDLEVQATFRQIEQTHPLQQVLGSCDREWCYVLQLMEAPPAQSPTLFGEHMAFWGADVDAVSKQTVQLRLWWRVTEPLGQDYSIGIQLLNADGTLVAQADGAVNHYNAELISTSQLQPDTIYIDYRTLMLPPEIVPGEYRLALVVYQWWDGVRLRLADGSDSLTLATVVIP